MKKSLVGAIASVAGFVLLGGGLIAVSVATRPAPEPVGVVTFIDPGGYLEEPTPTPTPEPVVVEPAPPAPEPVVESEPEPGAPGSVVPFIPSDDPENANGGDYIDPGIYCWNGSASTVGGVPVCD